MVAMHNFQDVIVQLFANSSLRSGDFEHQYGRKVAYYRTYRHGPDSLLRTIHVQAA